VSVDQTREDDAAHALDGRALVRRQDVTGLPHVDDLAMVVQHDRSVEERGLVTPHDGVGVNDPGAHGLSRVA